MKYRKNKPPWFWIEKTFTPQTHPPALNPAYLTCPSHLLISYLCGLREILAKLSSTAEPNVPVAMMMADAALHAHDPGGLLNLLIFQNFSMENHLNERN